MVLRKGQMRIGHQAQPGVEDAEDLVASEVEVVDVLRDLLVADHVTKAQVAIVVVQRQQMRQHARAVALGQGADRQPAPDLAERESGFGRVVRPG